MVGGRRKVEGELSAVAAYVFSLRERCSMATLGGEIGSKLKKSNVPVPASGFRHVLCCWTWKVDAKSCIFRPSTFHPGGPIGLSYVGRVPTVARNTPLESRRCADVVQGRAVQ